MVLGVLGYTWFYKKSPKELKITTAEIDSHKMSPVQVMALLDKLVPILPKWRAYQAAEGRASEVGPKEVQAEQTDKWKAGNALKDLGLTLE